MRVLIISIILVFLGIKLSYSQTYYPMVQENSSWVVKWWYYDPYLTSFEIKGADTYTIFDSIIYDSVAYKYLFDGDSAMSNLDYSKAHLMREDTNRQVFIRFAQDSMQYSKEFRIYDFGMEVGDTTSVYKGHTLGGDSTYYSREYTIVLTNIDTIIFAGQERRIYRVRDTSQEYLDDWIEGIGGIVYGFLSNVATIEISVSGKYFEETQCYWNDNIYWRKNSNRSCIYIGLPENEPNLPKIDFYPNPVVEKLRITGESQLDSYKVFDIHGALRLEGNFDDQHKEIDFISLNPGIYFVKVKGKHDEIWDVRIVKE